MKIYEYRGVYGLVAAEVTKDDVDEITFGTPFDVAGVSRISKETDSSSETHYYNNSPAIVIQGVSADTVTIDASAIPLDVLAKLTGQTYDDTLGVFIEGAPQSKYFAIGYQTKDTDGNEVYVWRLKGSFAIPGEEHSTIDNGTSANGQQLVYTGIETIHKFTKTGNPAKAVNVELAKDLAKVDTFFDAVQTPDTIVAK